MSNVAFNHVRRRTTTQLLYGIIQQRLDREPAEGSHSRSGGIPSGGRHHLLPDSLSKEASSKEIHMNSDTLEGQGTNLGGQIKEGVGKLTGNPRLEGEGVADQWAGIAQQAVGKVRDFVRDRPVAATLAAGVIGAAVLNSLRGRS